jgi:DNA processing protein
MQGTDPPTDRELLVALASREELPRAAVCRLGAELAAWRDLPAGDPALARRLSLASDTLSRALALRPSAAAECRAAETRAARRTAKIQTLADPDYPPALRDLSLPPPALHVAGDAQAMLGPAVAIVGSREASAYGLEVATWLATELARAGLVVVSGFARGVDAAAHRGALAADGGRTVAVLGCGLDCDYPRGQRPLARRIRRQGALVTEFACDAPPQTWRFPVRNRIIAALARATIVVEAATRSGSLITARLALELGRDVLAVPGRITDEGACGTNELLRDGATPISHPDDVLELLRGEAPAPGARRELVPNSLPRGAEALWNALDRDEPRPPEQLAEAALMGVDAALGALLDLELAGHAERLPGGLYRRR